MVAPATLALSNPQATDHLLYASAPLGAYQMPSPSVTMGSYDSDVNSIAVNSTTWWVLDEQAQIVGTGTMSTSATTFSPCHLGVWQGGGAVEPGWYTVVVSDGGTGVISIVPAGHLPMPTVLNDLEAYLWQSEDRSLYNWAGDGNTTAEILANISASKYFASANQDAARPHEIWITSQPAAISPTQDPTTAQWTTVATALTGAGHTGAWYELPTNEPEDGGWAIADIITYYNAAYAAVKAVDPTAKIMGYDSGGFMDNSPLSELATFLSSATGIDALSNHMENSDNNMSNLTALREYYDALKGQLVTSGKSSLGYWNTETGILGGGWNVLHPRRDARQRLIMRLVCESYGWCKERQYDFSSPDLLGSELPMYIFDKANNSESNNLGNMRAGGHALRILGEALWGTTCTVASPPPRINFGTAGSVQDRMFFGLHYTSAAHDVLWIAANGIETGALTLETNSTTCTVWDAWGKTSSPTISGGQVTIPIDDLCTYVFLDHGSTATVASTFWDSVGTLVGNWTASNVHGSGSVPGAAAPIVSSTLPYSFNVSAPSGGSGFAMVTVGPAWETQGCSIESFDILQGSTILYSYRCDNAVALPIRSGTASNGSDPCANTTWWTSPFGWLVQTPLPSGTLTVRINSVSYGGQPDTNNTAGDPQQVQLAAFQILESTDTGATMAIDKLAILNATCKFAALENSGTVVSTSRVAITWTTSGSNSVVSATEAFSGTASATVNSVGLYDASTAGNKYGTITLTGDTALNSSGVYDVTGLTITG